MAQLVKKNIGSLCLIIMATFVVSSWLPRSLVSMANEPGGEPSHKICVQAWQDFDIVNNEDYKCEVDENSIHCEHTQDSKCKLPNIYDGTIHDAECGDAWGHTDPCDCCAIAGSEWDYELTVYYWDVDCDIPEDPDDHGAECPCVFWGPNIGTEFVSTCYDGKYCSPGDSPPCYHEDFEPYPPWWLWWLCPCSGDP